LVTAQLSPLYNTPEKYEIISWENYSPKLQRAPIGIFGSKFDRGK
jgi:hypothetical protein